MTYLTKDELTSAPGAKTSRDASGGMLTKSNPSGLGASLSLDEAYSLTSDIWHMALGLKEGTFDDALELVKAYRPRRVITDDMVDKAAVSLAKSYHDCHYELSEGSRDFYVSQNWKEFQTEARIALEAALGKR